MALLGKPAGCKQPQPTAPISTAKSFGYLPSSPFTTTCRKAAPNPHHIQPGVYRCQRVPRDQPRWLQQTQEPLERGLQRLQLGQEPLSPPHRRGPLFDAQSPPPTLASFFFCVGNALSCVLHVQLRDGFFSCPTLQCLCPGTAAAMRRWL